MKYAEPLIRRWCLAKCLGRNSLISEPVYEEGALSGFLKRWIVRKGKGRRSTVRLMREFVQRDVRKKHLARHKIFVSFHRMEKKKKELNLQKRCTRSSSKEKI